MPTAFLGGLPLLAEEAVSWPKRAGTQPTFVDFDVEPDIAKVLVSVGGPLTLTINLDHGPPRVIEHLWPLIVLPGKDPHRRKVRVYDRRWFWQHGHILRRYNIRRPNGFFRIQADDVAELERVEERWQFAAYSVRDLPSGPGVIRWQGSEVVQDVAQRIVEIEADGGRGELAPVIFDFPLGFRETPVVDLEVDMRADSAFTRVLQYMPGVTVTVDDNGDVRLYDRTDGRDIEQLSPNDNPAVRPGPEIIGGGSAIVVDMSAQAPREIHLLFTPELELKLTFDAASQAAGAQRDEDSRNLYQCLPQPDYTLDYGTYSLPQNTYVDTDVYIAALPDMPFGGRLLDVHLREGALPFSDIFPTLVGVGLTSVDEDWAARAEGLNTHYYQTFRIARELHDRVLQWKAERFSTVNQAQGSRAPASAWGGYFRLGSDRSQFRDFSSSDGAAGEKYDYGFNVDGFADPLDNTVKPMPGLVSFLDAKQGILRLNLQPDPMRVHMMALPAQVETDRMPAFHRPGTSETTPISFDSIKDFGDTLPRLDDDHKMSVIVTAIPASPNDSRQLYRVIIKHSDLPIWTPDPIKSVAFRARGPIKEIRIPASMETARLRWDDAQSGIIDSIMGIGDAPRDPLLEIVGAVASGNLCVNATAGNGESPNDPGEGGTHVGAPLDEVAVAYASAYWASFVDHMAGTSTFHMQPTQLLGYAETIIDTVHPKGQSFTAVSYREILPELDPMMFLRREIAARIMREVL